MKYLVLLCDGMADLPVPELEGKTPMECAHKPNMETLAKIGEVGMQHPTPPGCIGGSDTGNMSVLGFDPRLYLTGRSPLEAAALGIQMAEDDAALRCNLVTLSEEEPYEQKIMVDYSADEITTEEASKLIQAVSDAFSNDMLQFYPGFSYRHCLILHHAAEHIDMILTPPHNITTQKITDHLPKGDYSALLMDMMRRSFDILNHHPVNEERRARGLRPANSIWLWGQGTKPGMKPFTERHGLRGAMITAVDLLKGMANLTGMKIYEVEGATGNLDTNFSGKAEAAITAFKDGYDLVYLHLEAPDECGHRHEVEGKIEAIEKIDELVLGPVLAYLKEQGEFGVLVTPDHPTPLTTRKHSNDPVPYLIYKTGMKQPHPCNGVFCEKNAKATGVIEENGFELIQRMVKL